MEHNHRELILDLIQIIKNNLFCKSKNIDLTSENLIVKLESLK